MQRDERRPHRQDTFDLRDQVVSDDHVMVQNHADATLHYNSTDDEEHSVLEDDSDGEDRDVDYMDEDDDGSSSLSIPNESIDFDLVYSLHSFAATVEGQANVVKGDSLFLMDDSNSYWWLVRVLKTQEVGYIPAENIETPFERLARLNKHRNVDVCTQEVFEIIDLATDIKPSSHPQPKQSSKKVPTLPVMPSATIYRLVKGSGKLLLLFLPPAMKLHASNSHPGVSRLPPLSLSTDIRQLSGTKKRRRMRMLSGTMRDTKTRILT
jgi:SH3 domain